MISARVIDRAIRRAPQRHAGDVRGRTRLMDGVSDHEEAEIHSYYNP